jgi:hypothetical protein
MKGKRKKISKILILVLYKGARNAEASRGCEKTLWLKEN